MSSHPTLCTCGRRLASGSGRGYCSICYQRAAKAGLLPDVPKRTYKLSETDREEIRREHANGVPVDVLALRFGVAPQTILYHVRRSRPRAEPGLKVRAPTDPELWRPVLDSRFPGFEISTLGRVRRAHHGAWRVLDLSISSSSGHPYADVMTAENSTANTGWRRRRLFVANAVLTAFHGPPSSSDKRFALHRNGNRLDCRLGNLCWATKAETMIRREDRSLVGVGAASAEEGDRDRTAANGR